MEIALNAESKRKTIAGVALRGGERMFESAAQNVAVKWPKLCYVHLLDILGKPFDHPQVADFAKRFPWYEMKRHPELGTVVFQHDEETEYSVEELMGMVLSYAKTVATNYIDQPVKDAVITVPVFFNQAERRALQKSAIFAGINVLQLMSAPMAIALDYGMFRRKEINGTARHLMFYDMGARDTTATIVAFQLVKTKERGFSETHPQAQILGVGYDRMLGGSEIDVRMRNFLAQKFNELGKTKTDVFTVPRAMGKFMKEAAKVKTVLSANVHYTAQVENVLENIDFRLGVTRAELHALIPDLFARVTGPIEQALKTSDMSIDAIDEIILVGAGTRVPHVQGHAI